MTLWGRPFLHYLVSLPALALLAASVFAGDSTHWAYRPIARPTPPQVQRTGWVRNPIDAFITARHEASGLTPAPEAPRRVLIRRLSLDLLGLPPTPEEVAAFEADRAPDAYEKLVERLLASPHYGERWARHWLDLARWAESEGYESNHLRPHAFCYRDYVVRSFNRDQPYAEFVRQQLAGDEMLPYADENLIATGFLAAARLSSNEEDVVRQRNDVLVDIVNATANTFLGITLNCAQCHNHKFDAFKASDYYRFLGFFLKGQPANLALKDPELWAAFRAVCPPEYEPAVKLRRALLDDAHARLIAAGRKALPAETLRALDTPTEERTPEMERVARTAGLKLRFGTGHLEKAIRPEDRVLFDELTKKIDAIEKRLPDRPQTFGFYSPVTSPTAIEVLPMKGFYPLPFEPKELAAARPHLLLGGDTNRRGRVLDVGWPAVFGPTTPEVVRRTPRLALADWLTSPKNPLTARVWVNRLWQYHFGRGLVATPSDFGVKGAAPTHPQLLDYLASELLRSGGSAKHLHRLIVCSQTYRQASGSAEARNNQAIDPENALLWHWPSRRLEAEALRDALLAVSGELERSGGGPSSTEESSRRRTLYLFQKREHPPAVQALFDGPSAAAESCPRRMVSTVPLQALYLLNNDFSLNCARALARRVRARSAAAGETPVEAAFALALGRAPDAIEKQAARQFFQTHAQDAAPPAGAPAEALVHFCQALLNLNEFAYLE